MFFIKTGDPFSAHSARTFDGIGLFIEKSTLKKIKNIANIIAIPRSQKINLDKSLIKKPPYCFIINCKLIKK
jgi:hypothetical protein